MINAERKEDETVQAQHRDATHTDRVPGVRGDILR